MPALSAKYIATWVLGARQAHHLTVDWVGMWNEHWEADSIMFAYAKELRRQLDAAGLQATKIIGPDAFTAAAERLCAEMQTDPVLRQAIGAIGVHGGIPGAGSACQQLADVDGLPLFSSEDGSTYGDTAGALLRVQQSNAEYLGSGSQGGNFWNPFGAFYPGIPFWGHSLLACHHPWSGHYTVRSTIWAGAHMCQHTQVGMAFVESSATGNLASGCGTMVTTVTPEGTDFTIVAARDGLKTVQAPGNPTCPTEAATFQLVGKLATAVTSVAVWLTQIDTDGTPLTEFERQVPDLPVRGGSFTVVLPPNSLVTITSLTKLGHKGAHPEPPAAASFPIPYAEDFNSYPHEGTNVARYFSDMSGGFEVIDDPTSASTGGVLRQATPSTPIGWYGLTADTLPYTQIGSFDWANYTAAASVHLPPASTAALGWVGAHLGGNPECDGPAPICSNPWGLYAVLDNNPDGRTDAGGWQLRLHLRVQTIGSAATALFRATIVPARTDATGGWARVELTIQGTLASVRVDDKLVLDSVDVTGPLTAPGATKSYLPRTGWVGLGGGPDYSTALYFDNFTVSPVAGAVSSTVSFCAPALRAGMPIVGVPCGLDVPGLAWDLNSSAGASHSDAPAPVTISPRAAPTLCTTRVGSALELQPCNGSDGAQKFYHPLGATAITSAAAGPTPGKPVSPWQSFTPGQGMAYGSRFGGGQNITATRHVPQHQGKEQLEFAVNGVSQGLLTMPLDLPDDVVGCVGVCNINSPVPMTVSAVAPALFFSDAASHGSAVTVSADGKTATWGASAGSCNQVAVLDPKSLSVAAPSFSVELTGAATTFIDVGWCSRSFDPTGKNWTHPPSAEPAGWMGEQGVGLNWIFRADAMFKASTDGPGGDAPQPGASWCLPDDDTINRGTVRPWEPAAVGKCAASNTNGGIVSFDPEFGYLWTGADTTGMCFGVCA